MRKNSLCGVCLISLAKKDLGEGLFWGRTAGLYLEQILEKRKSSKNIGDIHAAREVNQKKRTWSFVMPCTWSSGIHLGMLHVEPEFGSTESHNQSLQVPSLQKLWMLSWRSVSMLYLSFWSSSWKYGPAIIFSSQGLGPKCYKPYIVSIALRIPVCGNIIYEDAV